MSVGDRIGVPGGLHGRVEEIDADGAWVAVTGGALVQARWGEDIMVGGSRRPLTPPTGGLAADEGLVEALKAWRRETAAERSVPAYVVLHDATLETIAAIRPHDEASLAAVPGIGPAKLEAYGDAIIDLCSR